MTRVKKAVEEYKPELRFDPPIDETRCRAAVPYVAHSPEMHQCSKYVATDDNLCNQHARLKERDALERSRTEGRAGEVRDA